MKNTGNTPDGALVLLYSGATLATTFVVLQWPTFTAAAVMVALQVVLAILVKRIPDWRERRRIRKTIERNRQ